MYKTVAKPDATVYLMLAYISADLFGVLAEAKADDKKAMAEKAADVAIGLLGMCAVAGIDIEKAILSRLNGQGEPV